MEIHERAENWTWTKLGEISKISDRDHRTPKYVKSGYLLISPTNFTPFGIDFSKIKFVEEDEFLQFKKKCNPDLGDILYSRIGTIGEARLVDFRNDFVALHSISVIKPKPEIINSKFLLYLLNSNFIRRQALASIRSIGTPDLGLDRICNFKVPLPPLETQRRIVAILDKAEETRRLRAQADELMGRLIQSVFWEMFGDPMENPNGWKIKRLQELIIVLYLTYNTYDHHA
jgi:type I restriction enzyme, S subunit